MTLCKTGQSTITRIELIPLRDVSFVSLLRSFRSVLKTCVGPNGRYKLLVSGGGYVRLSSCSAQIVQHCDQFNSPIVRFVIQIMKGRPDFGLHCGLMIAAGLETLLTMQMTLSITPRQSINVLDTVIKNCYTIFSTDKLKIKVNFDYVSNFIPLVLTVLNSKCNMYLTAGRLEQLCLQVINSFLLTLDTERKRTGKISIRVHKGSEEFKYHPGVVYPLTDDDVWISNTLKRKDKNPNGKWKSLLFTTFLDTTFEHEQNIVDGENYTMRIIFKVLEKAVQVGVNLIVCQKVVHSDVVLYLRRKSVIVLERVGTGLANDFQRLSHSFPISDVCRLSKDDVDSMTGTIDTIDTVVFDDTLFLSIHNRTADVGTLFLKTPSLTGTHEIKILVEQAFRGLGTLLIDPCVCAGAGCFETGFFLYLLELFKKDGISSDNVKWLFSVLLEAAGRSLPIFIDSRFHHAWQTEDQSACDCKLINRSLVFGGDGIFHLISSPDDLTHLNHVSASSRRRSLKLTPDSIVDSFVHKRDSILVSLESCMNLLNVGTVVYSETC